MKFEIYKDSAGEWRWKLKAKNGRIIAVSSEGYKRKISVYYAIAMIQGAETVEKKK